MVNNALDKEKNNSQSPQKRIPLITRGIDLNKLKT